MTKLYRVKAATPNRILNTANGVYTFDDNCEAILPEDIIKTLPEANYRVLGEVRDPNVKETAPLVDDVTPRSASAKAEVTTTPGKKVDADATLPSSDENAANAVDSSEEDNSHSEGEKPSAEKGRSHRKRGR